MIFDESHINHSFRKIKTYVNRYIENIFFEIIISKRYKSIKFNPRIHTELKFTSEGRSNSLNKFSGCIVIRALRQLQQATRRKKKIFSQRRKPPCNPQILPLRKKDDELYLDFCKSHRDTRLERSLNLPH